MTFDVTIRDDVQAEMKVYSSDANIAAQMRAGLEQGKALLTLAALSNADFGPILTDIIGGIRFSQSGGTVAVKAEISAELIEKLATKAKEKAK
jgi:hypothetical protein